MSLMKRRLDRKTLRRHWIPPTKLATFVMFILIGARVFALTFYGISGDRWVEELLLALPGGEVGFLITFRSSSSFSAASSISSRSPSSWCPCWRRWPRSWAST
jgi:TRAP-type mannitol/chloroaromatic compound transport system permease large subunit